MVPLPAFGFSNPQKSSVGVRRMSDSLTEKCPLVDLPVELWGKILSYPPDGS